MSTHNTTFLDIGADETSRRIAYRTNGSFECQVSAPVSGPNAVPGPGLVWLSGFNSSMDGAKATELAGWATDHQIPMTRFDYSGHGQSSGRFEHGTISHWRAEAQAVLDKVATGPQILIGSSMGGWIALLIAQTLAGLCPGRIAGVVLIAPAWDMTERLMWKTAPQAVRDAIENEGVWQRPSEYSDNAYPITRDLIHDGRKHLLGDGQVVTGCPVRILHGLADPDVPWQGSQELIERLVTDDAQLTLVRGAGHRLSRPEDIRLLKDMIAGLLNRLPDEEPALEPAPL